VAGLGLLCLALLLVAVYGHSRSAELRVAVAGSEDLRVALEGGSGGGEDPARVLERALGTAGPAGDGAATGGSPTA
jgi:hypothetical protein